MPNSKARKEMQLLASLADKITVLSKRAAVIRCIELGAGETWCSSIFCTDAGMVCFNWGCFGTWWMLSCAGGAQPGTQTQGFPWETQALLFAFFLFLPQEYSKK